jgi:hypothetical protein
MEKRLMADAKAGMEKISWAGRIVAVQPRIRLMRSFDQRSHSYQGYVLRIHGICGGQACEFLIAVGQGAHEKYRFCGVRDVVAYVAFSLVAYRVKLSQTLKCEFKLLSSVWQRWARYSEGFFRVRGIRGLGR